MSAFDGMERTDIEPAGHLIARGDYLNASARPEAQKVRDLVDQLLDAYPADKRDEMVRRLRSRDDRLHRSASFELILHGMLLARGFTVIAVVPELAGGRSPDFLVGAPDGREFYLEATIAEGEIGADPGADRRLRDVLQALDDVAAPDFFLSVHHRGVPAQPVRVRRLRERVQRFVEGLDHAAVVSALEARRPIPFFCTEEHGLILRVEVVPKHVRGRPGRAIGGRMLPSGRIHPERPIQAAVEDKAGRYGTLDRPFIVAVSALDIYANADAAVDALFGSEQVALGEDLAPQWVRQRNGAWIGPGGPVHTRVSAVLSTERLSAWDVTQRRPRLIHNPWAAQPILDLPVGVDTRQVIDGRLRTEPGQTVGEILGLPAPWPEDEG